MVSTSKAAAVVRFVGGNSTTSVVALSLPFESPVQVSCQPFWRIRNDRDGDLVKNAIETMANNRSTAMHSSFTHIRKRHRAPFSVSMISRNQ